MKKFYIPFFALASFTAIAQQQISFEASEGFTTGTINQQNGWEVTEGTGGFIENQVISDELASDGTFSFKNAYEPAFDEQWFPIFGAAKLFETPADYSNFTISYDVLATATLGADFEFTLFSLHPEGYEVPVAGVGIENRGFIYLINNEDFGFQYAEAEWTPNVWTNVRIEVSETEIRYYINNALQAAIPNFTQLEILGFNMLHNNYGNDAYYDNFVITTESLGVNAPQLAQLAVYPNPANNTISLSVPENTEISEVAIFDLLSKKVIATTQTQHIDISKLAAGSYILKATTTNGSSITKKIIKN